MAPVPDDSRRAEQFRQSSRSPFSGAREPANVKPMNYFPGIIK